MDPNAIAMGRQLDTALLPLRLRGLAANAQLPIAAVAGGITMVANRLVVMDRLGNFYQCKDDCSSLAKVSLPPLPNHILEYASRNGSRVDEKAFRAHCVRFSSDENKLAVSHEFFDAKLGSVRFAVSVIDIDPDSLKSTGPWETIFLGDPEPYTNDQAGGALAWGKNGKLFVTVGDFGTEKKKAQDPESAFGKVFEIDLRSGARRMVSLGSRNAEGLAKSELLGLVTVENGPQDGDQLDIVAEGANSGWPNVSLGTDYHRYSFGDNKSVGRLAGYPSPLFAWVPEIAPSELMEVRGFDDRWDGDLLVASLKAQSLYRLKLDGPRVVYCEPIYIGKRIRDLTMMKPGVIAIWTDDAQLIFISVDREKLATDRRSRPGLPKIVEDQCMFCHHFGPTNASDFAPSLSGLMGRTIASDHFPYSPGLRRNQGVWTRESLWKFLSDPASFATGTGMPQMQLPPSAVEEAVRVLRAPGANR